MVNQNDAYGVMVESVINVLLQKNIFTETELKKEMKSILFRRNLLNETSEEDISELKKLLGI